MTSANTIKLDLLTTASKWAVKVSDDLLFDDLKNREQEVRNGQHIGHWGRPYLKAVLQLG